MTMKMDRRSSRSVHKTKDKDSEDNVLLLIGYSLFI